MKKIIKGSINTSSIKRCYVEGARIEDKCPKCGVTIERDFGDNYLSHPEVGESDEICFYCDECNTEWEYPIVVKSCEMVIEVDMSK